MIFSVVGRNPYAATQIINFYEEYSHPTALIVSYLFLASKMEEWKGRMHQRSWTTKKLRKMSALPLGTHSVTHVEFPFIESGGGHNLCPAELYVLMWRM